MAICQGAGPGESGASSRDRLVSLRDFLLLFFFGFGYMGLMSLLQTASGKRIAALWKPEVARMKAD